MNYYFKLKTDNVKTGNIPTTMSHSGTCPSSCSFKNNGCYAENFPLKLHWDAITSGKRGGTYDDMINQINQLPAGTFWRHNVAGDLVANSEGKIDTELLKSLVYANKGKKGFTYTHHKTSGINGVAIRAANKFGFTINLSADTLQEADEKKALNIAPVVVTVPPDQKENMVTPAGHTVIICPAVTKDNVSCDSCRMCQVAKRETIIGFPAHGARKKKVFKIYQSK